MTAPLYNKILRSTEENLYNLGYGERSQREWYGDVTIGTKPVAAALMNFSNVAVPAAGDKAFVARLRYDEVAGNQWPDAMTTRSHAQGYFAQGNAFAELFFEAPDYTASGVFSGTPATATAAAERAKWIEDVIHIYRGQFGARVRVYMCPAGTALAVNGVDGETADATGMKEVATLLPYGRIAAAGELA